MFCQKKLNKKGKICIYNLNFLYFLKLLWILKYVKLNLEQVLQKSHPTKTLALISVVEIEKNGWEGLVAHRKWIYWSIKHVANLLLYKNRSIKFDKTISKMKLSICSKGWKRERYFFFLSEGAHHEIYLYSNTIHKLILYVSIHKKN